MNGASGFFLLILAFVFLYFVLVRPQRRRQVETQKMLSDLRPGDEVVTAGGIYGTVIELLDEEDVLVEIAPQLRVRVARRAIGAIVHREDEPEMAPEPPTVENDG